MTQEDKNQIHVNRYRLSHESILIFYSAKWCGPCTRIFSLIEEHLKDYELISHEIIQKIDFKLNVNEYIPFFQFILDGNEPRSIQTSNFDNFLGFFMKCEEDILLFEKNQKKLDGYSESVPEKREDSDDSEDF